MAQLFSFEGRFITLKQIEDIKKQREDENSKQTVKDEVVESKKEEVNQKTFKSILK